MRYLACVFLGWFLISSAAVAVENRQSPLSFTYVSPRPGAQHISPSTSLAIRQGRTLDAERLNADLFVVTGSRSGAHEGLLRLSDDRRTLIFYPHEPFFFGEIVSVEILPGLATEDGAAIAGTRYQFATLEQPVDRPIEGPGFAGADGSRSFAGPADATDSPRYHTHPEFSRVITATVAVPAQDTGPGYVFVTGMLVSDDVDHSLMIYDDLGEPIYIKRTPAGLVVSDFKVQTVAGTPYLVYYLGEPMFAWAEGAYYVMDTAYNIVDTWTIGNGYGADLHELQLLENGHALMVSYTPIPWDLSPYGGPADGTVIDALIQEQDSGHNVVFEWHASQHIPLTDTAVSLRASPVDFMHTNAIEVDRDGHLMISSRSLSEITKIDRQSGEIIWRLGGKRNQFDFGDDIGFSLQHDIRRLPNGNITLFDNGNRHSPRHSRAVEYEIDEAGKVITSTWQYPAGTDYFAPFMGNFQRLDNGNSVIGWGALPTVTEVLPDGTKAFELDLGGLTYRAFRHPWDAQPAAQPRSAVAGAGDPTTATLFLSWNGATGISSYEVYAGPTSAAMDLITTTVRSGFETSLTLTGLDPATCVFRARPVHEQGATTPFSNLAYRLDLPGCRDLLNVWHYPLILVD